MKSFDLKRTITLAAAIFALGCTTLSKTSTATVTRAPAGGDGSGGGNVQRSTRADLEETVANMRSLIERASDDNMFGQAIEMTKVPLRADLVSITETVLDRNQFQINVDTMHYLQNMKYEIVDAPCYEGKVEKDASSEHFKGATVCLSATRLARFPKSSLKIVLLPLLFHEMAHQFGLGEDEANELQKLADLNLRYRVIYLAAFRAYFQCAFASESDQIDEDKKAITKREKLKFKNFAKITGANHKKQLPMACARNAALAGELLEREQSGDVWRELAVTGLNAKEKATLISYQGYPRGSKFTFLTLMHALTEPSVTGFMDCKACVPTMIDPAYLMMLGGKSAMAFIGDEVGHLQNLITPEPGKL